MARGGSFRHRFYRAIVNPGIVFGDNHDQRRHDQTSDAAEEQIHACHSTGQTKGCCRAFQFTKAIWQSIVHSNRQTADGQDAGCDQALIQGAHNIRGALAELDEIGANYRSDDTNSANRQWEEQDRAEIAGTTKINGTQNHGCNDGHRIGLEQVCCHTSTVTDIIANIIGDCRSVSRIILRDTGFNLADHVAANVSTFGKDTAAKTSKDRDQRGAKAQRNKTIDDFPAAFFVADDADQQAVIGNDAEQREANHEQARYCA